MGINWTDEELKEYKEKNKDNNNIKVELSNQILHKKIKRNKYGNMITKLDGLTFSSMKEARYYQQLLLQQQNGIINGFCMQPTFILEAGIKYKADFIVFQKDKTEIIELKGYETQLWKAKRKLFEKKYPNLKLKVIR